MTVSTAPRRKGEHQRVEEGWLRGGNNLLIPRRTRSSLRKNFSSKITEKERRAAAVKSRHSSMSLRVSGMQILLQILK